MTERASKGEPASGVPLSETCTRKLPEVDHSHETTVALCGPSYWAIEASPSMSSRSAEPGRVIATTNEWYGSFVALLKRSRGWIVHATGKPSVEFSSPAPETTHVSGQVTSGS